MCVSSVHVWVYACAGVYACVCVCVPTWYGGLKHGASGSISLCDDLVSLVGPSELEVELTIRNGVRKTQEEELTSLDGSK